MAKVARASVPVERLTPEAYVDRYRPRRRVDWLVLKDIAAHADWSGRTWGEHACPKVPAIAERIGYCERSVQYALRRLEREGRLEIRERPGRTNVWRITRHLQPVADAVETRAPAIDDASPQVRPDASSDAAATAPPPPAHVAPGGAKSAPDLVPLPGYAPIAPSASAGDDRSEAPDGAAEERSGRRRRRPGCPRHPARARSSCRNCQPTPTPPVFVPEPFPHLSEAERRRRQELADEVRRRLGSAKSARTAGGPPACAEGAGGLHPGEP